MGNFRIGLAKWTFSLRGLGVAILLLSLCLAIAILAREHFVRLETTGLFRIVIGRLRRHDAKHGSLPKAVVRGDDGVPTWSWRYLMSVQRDSDGQTTDLGLPWDSPWNRTQEDWTAISWPFSYREGSSVTCILAVTGPGTAFDDANARNSLRDMDGDTILLIEDSDSGYEWQEPGDADIRTLRNQELGMTHLSSIHPRGFHVAFADGQVWFIRRDTPFEILEKFLTVEGAFSVDRDRELGAYRIVF